MAARRKYLFAAIPLSIISMALFTKWWYVAVVDGPTDIFKGFPLPFVCSGWHTSLSLQIFIAPFLFNVAVYLMCWLLILQVLKAPLQRMAAIWRRTLGIGLWALAILVMLAVGFLASNPDNIYRFRRTYEMEIRATGYQFIWEKEPRPWDEDEK
ncbi:hypothetical protein GC194_06750 [bacterium]|nr:hypothetical protein [bacterium]